VSTLEGILLMFGVAIFTVYAFNTLLVLVVERKYCKTKKELLTLLLIPDFRRWC
jgi:hypothetical protein